MDIAIISKAASFSLLSLKCAKVSIMSFDMPSSPHKDDTVDLPYFIFQWPFKRLLGVQEPAAAFSSLLNFAANAYMFIKIRKEFPVRDMPLVLFWHVFAYVSI